MQRILLAVAAVLLAAPGLNANAQKAETTQMRRQIAGLVGQTYQPWESVEINGKLHIEGLAISPSVKIQMLRDSVVGISIRVPFLGEVGRLVATSDSVTVVNKINKVYCGMNLANLHLPAGDVGDLQNILLGRVCLPGVGDYNEENSEFTELYTTDQGGWLIVPLPEIAPEGANYGFLLSSSLTLEAVMVTIDDTDDSVTVAYDRRAGSEVDIEVTAVTGRTVRHGTLALEKPVWNSGKVAPIEINSKWKKVSLNQLLGSF